MYIYNIWCLSPSCYLSKENNSFFFLIWQVSTLRNLSKGVRKAFVSSIFPFCDKCVCVCTFYQSYMPLRFVRMSQRSSGIRNVSPATTGRISSTPQDVRKSVRRVSFFGFFLFFPISFQSEQTSTEDLGLTCQWVFLLGTCNLMEK